MPVKLSIVIPTYNSEATISVTLQSIVSLIHRLDSVEVIVIDGLSTDSTCQIIQNSALPVRLYSLPDEGIYDAMNKGVNLSQGDWIYFLGSDDILLPDFPNVLQYLDAINSSYYGNVLLSKDMSIYCGEFNSLKLQLKNICHQSIIYSKSTLLLHNFDLKYRLLADYALNLKLFASPDTHFKYLPLVLCRYNNQTGSSTRSTDLVFAKSKKRMILDNFGIASYLRYIFFATLLKVLLMFPFFRSRWITV